MNDSIHHRQLRANLVRQLRYKGIDNEPVLQAIASVPRHLFVETEHSLADMYADTPLSIGEGQTISQPFTVAYQTRLLNLKPGDKVLEIGTGSGYQAAVLFELGTEVFSIERQETLYAATRKRLSALGYSGIHLFYGDGNSGIPQHAPYDKILVTAAAPAIPQHLLAQLKTGGILVAPVTTGPGAQEMLKITKLSDTEEKVENYGHFSFVPLLPGIAPGKKNR